MERARGRAGTAPPGGEDSTRGAARAAARRSSPNTGRAARRVKTLRLWRPTITGWTAFLPRPVRSSRLMASASCSSQSSSGPARSSYESRSLPVGAATNWTPAIGTPGCNGNVRSRKHQARRPRLSNPRKGCCGFRWPSQTTSERRIGRSAGQRAAPGRSGLPRTASPRRARLHVRQGTSANAAHCRARTERARFFRASARGGRDQRVRLAGASPDGARGHADDPLEGAAEGGLGAVAEPVGELADRGALVL